MQTTSTSHTRHTDKTRPCAFASIPKARSSTLKLYGMASTAVVGVELDDMMLFLSSGDHLHAYNVRHHYDHKITACFPLLTLLLSTAVRVCVCAAKFMY